VTLAPPSGQAVAPHGYGGPVDPSDPPFTVDPDPQRPGTLVACGELDATTAPRLRAALDDLAAAATGDVQLDLGGLTFIDSSGLQSITTARRDLQADGRALRIADASKPVRRIFEVTGLRSLLVAD